MSTTLDIATVRPSDLTSRPSPSAPGIPAVWRASAASHEFESAVDALGEYKKKDTTQIAIRFKAVGNAPIMKQNFYKITVGNRFQAVIHFLRKQIGWKASDPLFTYINLAFSPAPDDTVSNLYKSFAIDNQLIVNYSTTAAWG